jgi:hypothetical protein
MGKGLMSEPFAGFSFSDFWNEGEYYAREYTDDPLNMAKIAEVESDLGYKLPASYVALMKIRNGGAPRKGNHRTITPTTWAEDHVALHALFSVGDAKRYSLSGARGSRFWIEQWEYPAIGIYFADCPSAGHDIFCLDYRDCGPAGEPTVVHVDQEFDYRITFVANDFESFIKGLEADDAF